MSDRLTWEEALLIETAISEGRVRVIPAGITSEWDGKSFRERRAAMIRAHKSKSRKGGASDESGPSWRDLDQED